MSVATKIGTLAALALVWPTLTPTVIAQQAPRLAPSAKVDIVVERYQGDKKIASLPYSLWLSRSPAGPVQATGSLRIGVQVPIGTVTQTSGTNGNGQTRSDTTTTSFQYQNVGTQIDCYLTTVEDHYWLAVNLRDTSLFDAGARQTLSAGRAATTPPAAALREFQFNSTMEMRDGQTAEFENATDKVSGEVVKTLVTLTIAK